MLLCTQLHTCRGARGDVQYGNMHESVYIFPGAPPAVDLLERCCASIDSRASCIFSERGSDWMTC